MTASTSASFAKCPACGHNVTVDENGNFRIHAKNPSMGAGSRKCRNGGKPADAAEKKIIAENESELEEETIRAAAEAVLDIEATDFAGGRINKALALAEAGLELAHLIATRDERRELGV